MHYYIKGMESQSGAARESLRDKMRYKKEEKKRSFS
jgi:hypothetical protein